MSQAISFSKTFHARTSRRSPLRSSLVYLGKNPTPNLGSFQFLYEPRNTRHGSRIPYEIAQHGWLYIRKHHSPDLAISFASLHIIVSRTLISNGAVDPAYPPTSHGDRRSPCRGAGIRGSIYPHDSCLEKNWMLLGSSILFLYCIWCAGLGRWSCSGFSAILRDWSSYWYLLSDVCLDQCMPFSLHLCLNNNMSVWIGRKEIFWHQRTVLVHSIFPIENENRMKWDCYIDKFCKLYCETLTLSFRFHLSPFTPRCGYGCIPLQTSKVRTRMRKPLTQKLRDYCTRLCRAEPAIAFEFGSSNNFSDFSLIDSRFDTFLSNCYSISVGNVIDQSRSLVIAW